MEYRIEHKDEFKIVGFEKTFSMETSYEEIPNFWDEVFEKYAPNIVQGLEAKDELEKYIQENDLLMLGVCLDDAAEANHFPYMIAGFYKGGEVPSPLTVREIGAYDWAVFDCTMSTLQDTNTYIMRQWFNEHPEYTFARYISVECYGEMIDENEMKCQIWVPVKMK